MIGSGTITRFWSDNWLGEKLTGPQPSDANLTVANWLQLLEEFCVVIPPQFREKIQNVTLEPSQQDKLIFTGNDSGSFTSKSYQVIQCQQGRKRGWARWIWHGSLIPNIAAFLWKILWYAIPVDSRLQSKGIIIASRYNCCHQQNEETIVHLFLHLEIANAVWQCF